MPRFHDKLPFWQTKKIIKKPLPFIKNKIKPKNIFPNVAPNKNINFKKMTSPQETIKKFLFKGEDDHENLEIRTIEVIKCYK